MQTNKWTKKNKWKWSGNTNNIYSNNKRNIIKIINSFIYTNSNGFIYVILFRMSLLLSGGVVSSAVARAHDSVAILHSALIDHMYTQIHGEFRHFLVPSDFYLNFRCCAHHFISYTKSSIRSKCVWLCDCLSFDWTCTLSTDTLMTSCDFVIWHQMLSPAN